MAILNRADAFRILLGVNIALLLVHTLVESTKHNVNWLQIGERSRVAQLIITVEGSAALRLGMALYEKHYPEMMEMMRSKETRQFLALLSIQLMIWCLYR